MAGTASESLTSNGRQEIFPGSAVALALTSSNLSTVRPLITT
jgi:hypothetical protein